MRRPPVICFPTKKRDGFGRVAPPQLFAAQLLHSGGNCLPLLDASFAFGNLFERPAHAQRSCSIHVTLRGQTEYPFKAIVSMLARPGRPGRASRVIGAGEFILNQQVLVNPLSAQSDFQLGFRSVGCEARTGLVGHAPLQGCRDPLRPGGLARSWFGGGGQICRRSRIGRAGGRNGGF